MLEQRDRVLETHISQQGLQGGLVAPPVVVVGSDSNSSSSSFIDVTGLSLTWTATAGRLYRITVTGNLYSDTDTGASMGIMLADASSNPKKYATVLLGLTPNSATSSTSWYESGITAGSTTRKVMFRRAGGSGTHYFGVNLSDYPSVLVVEDVGPS